METIEESGCELLAEHWPQRDGFQAEEKFIDTAIKAAIIDAMIAAMLEARDHGGFVSAVRALDRVLMSGFYAIPLFNVPEQWIARWNRIEQPTTTALTGYLPETWWQKPETK